MHLIKRYSNRKLYDASDRRHMTLDGIARLVTSGERARAVYSNEKVPTIILLNPAGSEVYRTEGKLPRTGKIRDKLAEVESSRQ